MTRRPLNLGLAVGLLVALLGARPAPAGAPAFTPCPDDHRLGCDRVSVPLDRRGLLPGAVSLSVRRRTAGSAPSTDAVVALAGGPGQAALPLVSDFENTMGPALATRDLLIFDQRGTGDSGPLHCPALDQSSSAGVVAASCAMELGSARGSYTTSDSVDDLDAVRRAAGYDKLVLFGVSYGTKVALEYAERYPQHVEALVLDSVVSVTGPDPFQRSSFAAMPRVLGDLCAQRACTGITANPAGDIAALVARLARAPLRGHVFDGAGRPHSLSMGRGDLLAITLAGDENPALRAELPAAVHSALHGDPAPLLRLALLAAGLTPDALRLGRLGQPDLAAGPDPPRQADTAALDNTLYVTTTCEELNFPWDRNAAPDARLAQAAAQARALPASAVAPFDQTTALLGGPIPVCLEWPVASPPPPGDARLPAVPTLVLSGAADLRTPSEDAQQQAARIPGAQLIVVPYTGHSVLGTELSKPSCSKQAVAAFFGGGRAAPCVPASNPFSPTPVPPARLSQVAPVRGLGERAGRTASSILITLIDLRREIIGAILTANRTLPAGARFGGLRGGSAVITSTGVRLRSFSFVPGVTLSGAVPARLLTRGRGRAASLRVGGGAAASGSVRIAAGYLTSGTLGGHRFRAHLARAASVPGDWSRMAAPLSSTPLLARVP